MVSDRRKGRNIGSLALGAARARYATVQNPAVTTQLVYMTTHLREIPSLNTRSECTKLSIEKSFEQPAAVESSVDGAIGPEAAPIKKKLEYVT